MPKPQAPSTLEPREVFYSTLILALSTTRPEGSKAQDTLRRHLASLAEQLQLPWSIDEVGNLIVENGGATVWTAHLDTVAPVEVPTGLDCSDPRRWHTGGRAVLGADDGAGVAVLAGLMAARKPGLYCFTVDEERGAAGARHLVQSTPDRLQACSRAVAFDRKGRADLVTRQLGRVMASLTFADAVADGLGMGHKAADGVFTDNAEFFGLVPEIINLSCGYEANHSKAETLDYEYLATLFDRALALDWESLPTIGPAPDEDGMGPFGWSGDPTWTDDRPALSRLEVIACDLADALGLSYHGVDFDLIMEALEDAEALGHEAGWGAATRARKVQPLKPSATRE